MIVMKFGGSSVGNAPAIKQVCELVARNADRQPVVVVSALSGVTDQLLALAKSAGAGQAGDLDADVARLRQRHVATLQELGGDTADCRAKIDAMAAEILQALKGVALLRELSGRSTDLIVSFGERMSAPIVAAGLAARGLAAQAVDARQIIETDDRFTSANVRFEPTDKKIRAALTPLLASGAIPVVTGFIAATAEGITTTLGRGGSDYSVAILAGALEA